MGCRGVVPPIVPPQRPTYRLERIPTWLFSNCLHPDPVQYDSQLCNLFIVKWDVQCVV